MIRKLCNDIEKNLNMRQIEKEGRRDRDIKLLKLTMKKLLLLQFSL